MRAIRHMMPVAAAAVAVCLSSQAGASINITSGNATFLNTAPTTATHGNNSFGACDFRPEGPATTDHFFANGWFWRINGPTADTRESAFSSSGTGFTESSVANIGTRSWTGLSAGKFNATITYTLTDGASAGQALLTQTMVLTNTSGGTLDMSLFSYLDADVNGDTVNSDSVAFDATNNMKISDTGGSFVNYEGINANAYMVTDWLGASALRTLLTNTAVNNLDNSGVPFGPGDFTGGYQWNNTALGNGETMTVNVIFSVNTPIPAPGAFALLGIAGFVSRRRRRIA